jgi:anthranilate phosphoribosyltransferase
MTEKLILKKLFKYYGLNAATGSAMFERLTAEVKSGRALSQKKAQQAMVLLMSGALAPEAIAAFLTVMHKKGETITEIAAFAKVMRDFAPPIFQSRKDTKKIVTIDPCGTGGGTVPTFNVSTVAAFILAAAGLKVAKHGNRAITSRAGSADVFEALGIPLDLTPAEIGRSVKKVGIGFLFAPRFHTATRFVQPVRKDLPHKTFFNILGPLTNPAKPRYQVIGVYDAALTTVVAQALKKLGVKRAMVVHGLSMRKGECLDEISLCGPTRITELKQGKIRTFTFDPRRYGFKFCKNSAIAGGSAPYNAQILEDVLQGKATGPQRDIVVLNAAAGLIVGGKAENFPVAIKMADGIISSGKAYTTLQKLVAYSKRR